MLPLGLSLACPHVLFMSGTSAADQLLLHAAGSERPVSCASVCVCGYNTVLPLFHTVSELAASLTTSISSHLA